MQSKTGSLIEAVCGTVIGLVLSFCAQIVIYPAMGVPITIKQNIMITFIFFCISIVRGYLVRRLFNKIFKKHESN